MEASIDTKTQPLTEGQRIRAIVAGCTSNLIEWYDFYVYAFLALYFAPAFFPEGDQTAQLLNVAGIYAAGFFARPVGGWYFGRLADRVGRRRSLVVAVLLMGAGSLAIAVMPTYAVIGVGAPVFLLAARLLQGFSTGGLYGTAAAYLSEVANSNRRGFYASFQFVTLIGGQLLALLSLTVLQQVMTDDIIREWGWRAPFLFGAVLAGSIIFFRHGMHETIGGGLDRKDSGTLKALVKHPVALFIVFAMTAGGAVCIYTFTTYMQKFLVNTAGFDVRTTGWIMIGAMLVFMASQPVIGALSDTIGRRWCLLIFSGTMAVLGVPILTLLSQSAGASTRAFFLVSLALVILSFYTSISGLFKAELFPPKVRALGVSMAHAVAAAVFGGSTEYLALLAKHLENEAVFFWYLAVVCAISFIVALRMREPKRADMMSED